MPAANTTRRKARRPKKPVQSYNAKKSPAPKEAKTMFVVCPGCKGRYLQLGEHYDPDAPLRGYMLDMAEPYAGWKWSKPFSDHDLGPALECPGCNAPLLQGNRDKPLIEEG